MLNERASLQNLMVPPSFCSTLSSLSSLVAIDFTCEFQKQPSDVAIANFYRNRLISLLEGNFGCCVPYFKNKTFDTPVMFNMPLSLKRTELSLHEAIVLDQLSGYFRHDHPDFFLALTCKGKTKPLMGEKTGVLMLQTRTAPLPSARI